MDFALTPVSPAHLRAALPDDVHGYLSDAPEGATKILAVGLLYDPQSGAFGELDRLWMAESLRLLKQTAAFYPVNLSEGKDPFDPAFGEVCKALEPNVFLSCYIPNPRDAWDARHIIEFRANEEDLQPPAFTPADYSAVQLSKHQKTQKSWGQAAAKLGIEKAITCSMDAKWGPLCKRTSPLPFEVCAADFSPLYSLSAKRTVYNPSYCAPFHIELLKK